VNLVLLTKFYASLFDVSNTFYYSILVCLHRLTHVRFNVSWKTCYKRQI